MTTPLHHSLLSQELTCHLRSDSSFSTGNLQYPLAEPHLLSLRVKIPLFPQEAPPSTETTINPKLLSLQICHSMQRTPHTPLTTPQRTPSPAPRQKLTTTTLPPVQAPYQSHHDHTWRSSTLWDQYIRTQGLKIPDPLYKSSEPRCQVKKPRHYVATLEECFHQEQMALLGQPMNGRRLTRGLLGKIMDQDLKSHRASH